MLQRSSQWYQDRLGRFTASQADRLVGKEGLVKTREAIKAYAMEKAAEMYFGIIEDDFLSFDMQRGIDIEPLAFAKYSELRAMDFVTVQQVGFFTYGDHAGASPDGLTSEPRNLEMKCPAITTFSKFAMTGEINPKYYAQMQMQMMCASVEVTDFFNYCVHNGNEYHLTIEVPRDEAMVKLLQDRIEYAASLKLEYYSKLCDKFGPKTSTFIADYDQSVNATIITDAQIKL